MNFTKEQKETLMQLAFDQADLAQQQNEIPIWAVVVDADGNVLGTGYNRRELDQDAIKHAEVIAIQEACAKLGTWRLENCAIFVTLEPCPMCAGAIINSRLAQVYYGAHDPKAGAAGSVVNLFTVEKFNHHPEVFPGLYEGKASQILKDFFGAIRQKRKAAKDLKKN